MPFYVDPVADNTIKHKHDSRTSVGNCGKELRPHIHVVESLGEAQEEDGEGSDAYNNAGIDGGIGAGFGVIEGDLD